MIATIAAARPPSEIRSPSAADFHPIVLPPAPSGVVDAPILDVPAPSRGTGSRTTVDLPDTVEAQPKIPPHPKLTGHRVGGSASWYCLAGVSVCQHSYSGGMYAAAGPALRVGDWRGRQVRVCAGSDCIWVRLIDWCSCGSGHIIDLYSDAFRRLAPLDSGAVRVTVSW